MVIKLLRSWQLPHKKRERSNFIGQAEWRGEGGNFSGLAHHSCQSTDHNGNSYFRLDTSHKFQNKTGLDAKANSELYKSNRVNSVDHN
jgi:hypothetical protein